MKRKRKENCPSPLLDESPKRTKVQAQRKFAQNSGVHSPIISPIRDLETSTFSSTNVTPEPVELLPMKRPNTDDFLTFLCFRGTPLLPPKLQFFNTASIVTDGQVHEIKGESSKNGPIDITKCSGNSSEKPFIAFGVRKRADPIVISRQMEKKRRHALAIQALRRKYQEQKMAKIRALTISKLSEKTTNRTLVKTNTIQKTETVTKKSTNTLQKTKVVATKHVKVTTETCKTKVKPRMCLRSFRGKLVQNELPFRSKRVLRQSQSKDNDKIVKTRRHSNKPDNKPINKNQINIRKQTLTMTNTTSLNSRATLQNSAGRSPLSITSSIKRAHVKRRILFPSTVVSPMVKPKLRSTTVKKTVISRKNAQQRLRANIMKQNDNSSNDSLKKDVPKKASQEKSGSKSVPTEEPPRRSETPKSNQDISRRLTRRDSEIASKALQDIGKKERSKSLEEKKVNVVQSGTRKIVRTEKNLTVTRNISVQSKVQNINKKVAIQKSTAAKSKIGDKLVQEVKTIETTSRRIITRKSGLAAGNKLVTPSGVTRGSARGGDKAQGLKSTDKESVQNKKEDEPTRRLLRTSGNKNNLATNKNGGIKVDLSHKNSVLLEDKKHKVVKTSSSSRNIKVEEAVTKPKKELAPKLETLTKESASSADKPDTETANTIKSIIALTLMEINHKKEEDVTESKTIIKNLDGNKDKQTTTVKIENIQSATSTEDMPIREGEKNVETSAKKLSKQEGTIKKPTTEVQKRKAPIKREESDKSIASSRPTRKTKEAAAIYMEILSHKLVNDSIIDDDNISIDSFPELPNVKKTEQREIELKAQAKTSKSSGEVPVETSAPKRLSDGASDKSAKAKSFMHDKDKSDEDSALNVTDKRQTNPLPTYENYLKDGDDSENKAPKIKTCKESGGDLTDEEVVSTRRQTRQSLKDNDDGSSDQSFHVDIKVSRKTKMTRSRNKSTTSASTSVLEKNVDIILEAARVLESEKNLSVNTDAKLIDTEETAKAKLQSDSDESTTSDINLKSLQTKQRNKKKILQLKTFKAAATFSDSDEEPLSKLTTKSVKSSNDTDEPKKKTTKNKPPLRRTADKQIADALVMEPKPKRECTKRPSNYLAMLSSSEEEEEEPYFHGFNMSKEEVVNKPKLIIQSMAPSLDLLNKDLGRKGKVNMSNEQIEQWLKDSALASSSVAKENDAMLKFGEKIPAECPKVEIVRPPTIPNLKLETVLTNTDECPGSSKTASLPGEDHKQHNEVKSPLSDRKWIFKKDKKGVAPNKNAFSPENECSVYAFGEETEEVVSTPFRRPTRRASSTATSRSEDELSKNEDFLMMKQTSGQFRRPNPSDSEDSRCFNIPQNPAKSSKSVKLETMVPPLSFNKRQTKTNAERVPEPFDDSKYKVPSSPSASSGSSARLYKKGSQKQKSKAWESINPVYVSDFPKPTDPAKLVEAPVFHPTEQEFQDPLEYIERIRHKAEQFGLCKIVPPSSFKPECKVSDDMRFTAYNQYVHKMLHRWGPNFKEFMAIKKYLSTQSISLKTPPLIGGMEIDLPRLYQTVQSLGGLKEVIEKKKWPKVSDSMKIPKLAQDRVTKLDDIYCKYLLPYDTLSPVEREKLFDEVETYWARKESRILEDKGELKCNKQDDTSDQEESDDSEDNDSEECTVKGKNMALNAFYRIARNTMAMYFKVPEPTTIEVEQEFWRYVIQKQNHICVHSASIDCGTWGYGFAVSKNSPFAKHSWNLKVLSNNNGSVLRSLGPVMGVTIPTLHVGMVFSACCWYRDPQGLPWLEYLHTGGTKVWYGIPSSSCEVFHGAMKKLVPHYCRDKQLWLPSDTAMIPPGLLIENNVSLCRTIQEPGQFIVVFPKVFTSSISSGYVVSESVYFAPLYWLKTARSLFDELKESCEPAMFSLDKLFIRIANDNRSSVETLRVIVPYLEEIYNNEKQNKVKLRQFGVIPEERIAASESQAKKQKIQSVDGDFECEICRTNLYISMIIDTEDDYIYCLEDALKLLAKDSKLFGRLKLRYSLDENELENILVTVSDTIEGKVQKKLPSKFAGMPTLLK